MDASDLLRNSLLQLSKQEKKTHRKLEKAAKKAEKSASKLKG